VIFIDFFIFEFKFKFEFWDRLLTLGTVTVPGGSNGYRGVPRGNER
jgi:hypothetical protein